MDVWKICLGTVMKYSHFISYLCQNVFPTKNCSASYTPTSSSCTFFQQVASIFNSTMRWNVRSCIQNTKAHRVDIVIKLYYATTPHYFPLKANITSGETCELEAPRVLKRQVNWGYTVTLGLALPSLPVSCLSRPCLPGDENEKWQHADSSRALEWQPLLPHLCSCSTSILLLSPPRGTPGRDQWNIESPLSPRHFNNRRLQYPTCR